jgi:hypothetical protein
MWEAGFSSSHLNVPGFSFGLASAHAAFAGLISLKLDSWQAEQLPASLGQLANLRSLSINYGSMHSLPDSISRLTALTGLRLEHCSVEMLPSSLGQLAQLKRLYIDHCESLLELPASLSQLKGTLRAHVEGWVWKCCAASRLGQCLCCGTSTSHVVHCQLDRFAPCMFQVCSKH